jgi:hypothetical protein
LHGTPIQALDRKGRLPLYYCCSSFRKHKSFKYLFDTGADITSLHDSIRQPFETENSPKVNLLQIVLDTKLQINGGQNYLSSTKEHVPLGWEAMTSVLIDADLSFDRNHPIIAVHIQSFCYLSNLDLVEMLLGLNIEEKVGNEGIFLTDFILPSAL